MKGGKALLGALVLFCAGCDQLLGVSEERAKRAVAEQLIDPTSAQFRNVHVLGDSVCGEVNGKNKMGAYVGFRRFVFDRATNEPSIDPEFDYADLSSARDLCSTARGNEYSSLSTTMSVCERVSELESTELVQAAFNRAWGGSCGPATAKQVYRPQLNHSTSELLETADGAAIESDTVEGESEANSLTAEEEANTSDRPERANSEASELIEPDV